MNVLVRVDELEFKMVPADDCVLKLKACAVARSGERKLRDLRWGFREFLEAFPTRFAEERRFYDQADIREKDPFWIDLISFGFAGEERFESGRAEIQLGEDDVRAGGDRRRGVAVDSLDRKSVV